jgi:pimeloyl-ACP methyl ester carboxylesterase
MEVIQAMNEAIDKILTKAHAKRVNLIGFSGGGTIAMLAALWRSDVNKIITVSANLDHREWSRHHQVSSLTNSLNPADYTDQLSSIEQHHFVGAKDKITPPVLLIKFHNKFLHLKHKSHIYIIDNFTHSCCWEEAWSEILKEAK